MLNHSDRSASRKTTPGSAAKARTQAAMPVFSDPFSGDWCVGSDPIRWDIPFTVRLMQELKRLFRRRELSGELTAAPVEAAPARPAPRAAIRLPVPVSKPVRRAA